VHEGGFGVTATDDGVFVFTRPDASRIPACGGVPNDAESGGFRGIVTGLLPNGQPDPEAFEKSLRFHLQQLNPDPDLKIDAHTSRCKWLGERMDYNMAIEGIQFREQAAAAPAAQS